MKRICSLLLALVMVFGLFPTASAATGIGDYPALELETDLVITSSDDGYTYVTFTPETSGSYVFYNKDTGDTDAALYTADMVELAYSDDCWEDHGFHGSLSFCITYDLEAGQTYVLGAAFLSGKIADMTIRVDRNHSYEKTITKEPTCTEEGEATYTCTVCGYSYTEALPPEHRYEETIIKEPTCTEEGEAIYTCTICGDSYTGTVPSILMFEVYEDHVTVSGYNGTPTELVIPAEYEGLPVTAISDFAFYDCSSLTSIVIPDGVTYIGARAFENCHGLSSIYFEGDAPEIGEDAFLYVTATAHYPAGNTTWTADVMQNYGGEITWVAYDPNAPVNPFTDVPAGCWYEAPVLWALENGITDGTSATTFSPGNQCLRAHVVTFLWNAEKTPEPAAASSSFSDVPAGAWYEKPVLWAVEKGITSGVSPTKFGAGDVCSRYQVVFFLWKAAGSPEPKTTVNPFTDVNPGHFFYKAVLWAVENGITSGTSDTTFSPTQPCNRAQVVTFLYAAYN